MNAPKTEYILLDGVAGWQAATTGLSAAGDRGLGVDALPGLAEPFGKLGNQGLGCPGAMTLDPCEQILYWLDDRGDVVRRAPLPAANLSEELPGIGGRGAEALRFHQARGLGVFSDGSIAVSDTRNHRVQVFSAYPHALLAVVDRAGDPLAYPWGLVVDECGNFYVADRGNGRLLEFYRDGTFRRVVLSGLAAPAALARARSGELAVLEENAISIRAGGQTARIPAPGRAVSLAFDDRANLYAGTEDGLIFKYAPDTGEGGNVAYRDVGVGVIGRDAAVRLMAWTKEHSLLIAGFDRCRPPARLWRVRADGAYAQTGSLATEPLDSKREECVWHRVELDARIPEGCSIEVATQTSERNIWSDFGAEFQPDPALKLGPGQTECLVQSAGGRYLRLLVRLNTNGLQSPVLRSIRLQFPRDSYLKYLPAVYQEDPESRTFLDRFLSIFQTSFDAFDRQIDNISQLFDPLATPERMFPWLAAWLALPLSPKWAGPSGLAEGRTALKEAWQVYQLRGTGEGLRRLIRTYAGVEASVIEDYRLRPLLILSHKKGRRLGESTHLWSRDFYARLQLDAYSKLGYFRLTAAPEPALEPLAWGAHRFSVFFLAEPGAVEDTLKQVKQVVEREKPAHTEATYCPVLPRMRVGVQATVGVDTRLGVVTPAVLSKTATLGYDSILGCSRHEESLRGMGASRIPRAGVSSRLQ